MPAEVFITMMPSDKLPQRVGLSGIEGTSPDDQHKEKLAAAPSSNRLLDSTSTKGARKDATKVFEKDPMVDLPSNTGLPTSGQIAPHQTLANATSLLAFHGVGRRAVPSSNISPAMSTELPPANNFATSLSTAYAQLQREERMTQEQNYLRAAAAVQQQQMIERLATERLLALGKRGSAPGFLPAQNEQQQQQQLLRQLVPSSSSPLGDGSEMTNLPFNSTHTSLSSQLPALQQLLWSSRGMIPRTPMNYLTIDPSAALAGSLDRGRASLHHAPANLLISSSTQATSSIEEMFERYGEGGGNRDPPFPLKLHHILSRPEYQDCITWLPHGKSWRILKPSVLEEVVIPTHFRHAKYASFMRQVNGWGFKRLAQGIDHNSYGHELFLRDQPELCLKMKRIGASSSKRKSDVQHESEEKGSTDQAEAKKEELPVADRESNEPVKPVETIKTET